MRVRGPWVVLLLLSLGAGLGWLGHRRREHTPAEERRTPPGPILLISLDNVRADMLGCYRDEESVTPHLDRLAEKSLVYRDATSSCNWTLPAHTSLLTSLFPRQHGVINHSYRLDDSVPTMAESLKEAGYHTAAFVAHANVSSALGMARGFDEWWDAWAEPRQPPPADPPAEMICQRTLDHILARHRENPQAKSFVFLHLFTAHWPYEPDADLAERLDPDYDGVVDGSGPWVMRYQVEIRTPEEKRDFEHLRALHTAEVGTLDRALGILFDGMHDAGLMDDYTVIVTSDHGEALREHGVFTHGYSMFQEEVRIPLLLKLPEPEGVNRVTHLLDRPVNIVDIAPTILALARAPSIPGAQGWSLLAEPATSARVFIVESNLNHLFMDFERVAIRAGPIKYVFAPAVDWYGVAYGEAVFDLAKDPGETKNLLETQPGLRQEFRRILSRYQYEVIDALAVTWGPGLPADCELIVEAEEPIPEFFRLRTASAVKEDGGLEQADIETLQSSFEDGVYRVRLSGITTKKPAGFLCATESKNTTIKLSWAGAGDRDQDVQIQRGQALVESVPLSNGPLKISVGDVKPLPHHFVPEQNSMWIGSSEILRYVGPTRGASNADISPEIRELLEATGYTVKSD